MVFLPLKLDPADMIMDYSTYRYKFGGHLSLDAPSYVVRQADHDLYHALLDGELCYVLNSRQMGKTSLRVRTMHKLNQQGIACAAIDLIKIGSQDITCDQWYAGVMRRLVTSFHLFPKTYDLEPWLAARQYLSPLGKFDALIDEVLLEKIQSPIVIFIDEIESLRSLPFSLDDFFLYIRSSDESRNLTFALLGVSTPPDLIKPTHRSGFNVGRAIDLQGFQLDEATPLIKGLEGKVARPEIVLGEILRWTGGQPFLTQKLCHLVATANSVPTRCYEADWLADLVQDNILDNWEAHDEPSHLRTIRDRLVSRPNEKVLRLYQDILKDHTVSADNSAEQLELQLSGLVVKRNSHLSVYNEIYAKIFDYAWVHNVIYSLPHEFLNIVNKQEQRLLSMLNVMGGKGFDYILNEILSSIILKLGEMLNADQVTIMVVDQEKDELWSIVAKDGGTRSPNIQILSNKNYDSSIQGQLTELNLRPINDQAHQSVQNQTSDPIYDEIFLPLDEFDQSVAFVRLLNKVQPTLDFNIPLKDRLDPKGFTESDKQKLHQYKEPIKRILERCQDCYKLTQRLQASEALTEATRSLSQSSLESDEIIQRVMDAAKQLMNADRSTLWLLDVDNDELWTKISLGDNSEPTEIRIPVGQGYAGQVAQTGEALNIPFDLYEHPGSDTAKQTDQRTKYRTCSLLCLPVYGSAGNLLGVTQLVNKRRPGDFLDYDARNWPEAPECFQASFDATSQKHMEIFNTQVGVAIENARKFEALQTPSTQNVVSRTLNLLNQVMDTQGFDQVLDTTLRSITQKLAESLGADRSSIFLLDEERHEFWTIVAEGNNEHDHLEIRVPADKGIVGEVARTRMLVNLPYDFYNDERSLTAQKLDIENGYRTYTLLSLPLINEKQTLVAVVQLLNKLNPNSSPFAPLSDRIDKKGFTEQDIEKFKANSTVIQLILESFCSYHKTARGQRVAAALIAATRSLEPSSVEPGDLLQRMIRAAQDLMSADRGTLWLLDRNTQELWTKIAVSNTFKELRVKIGQGFAGRVAAKGEVLNIPFDLYNHPDSETAKKTDQKSGYRTCSLLCMPIFDTDGELIGVTQLINKKKSREGSTLHLHCHNDVPDAFQTSFDDSDRKCLQIFNNQVGTILQTFELLATVKQQEEELNDS